MQCVTMVESELGMRGGITGKGFQWDIIEVKGGPEVIRLDDIWVSSDLLDMVVEEVAESVDFS